jgi:3-isopropylmalate/(R)-2-methylmalate dehydratase small subunit
MTSFEFRGRCHKFADDIPLDDGLIPFELAIGRVMEPERLIPRLFEDLRPEFAKIAKPGDVVVAGRRFACGKAHVQGFIALQALGIAVICESMPFNSFRAAVSRGLVFMTDCEGVSEMFEDGDDIAADFATGTVTNVSRNQQRAYLPLDESLRAIISSGGSAGTLERWWREEGRSKNNDRPGPREGA